MCVTSFVSNLYNQYNIKVITITIFIFGYTLLEYKLLKKRVYILEQQKKRTFFKPYCTIFEYSLEFDQIRPKDVIDIVYTKEDVVKKEAVEWQYADVIQQHVDPIQLKEKNILIAIKEDATCWGRWAKEESSVWMQLTDGQFSKSIFRSGWSI